MPELPEVETIRRGLLPKIKGKKIDSAILTLPRLLEYPAPAQFLHRLKNTSIRDIGRHGKYLLFHLDNKMDLMIHLGMTGRLFVHSSNQPLDKHTHFRLKLYSSEELRFVDARTFGKLALIFHIDYSPVFGLAHLGIDPLSPKFTLQEFTKVTECNRQLKAVLMDQSRIAGLGNIYVDEVLHRAFLNPKKSASRLKFTQIEILFNSIREILKEALHYRGTTILSYVDSEVRYGEYQDHLKVYGRENEPCRNCGNSIRRIILVSRSTFYCPKCQRK